VYNIVMHRAGFIKKTAKMRHKAVLDPTRYFYNFLYSRLVFVNHMLELFPLHRYISTINAFRSRTLHIMYKHPPTCIIFRYTQHVHLSKIRILRHTSWIKIPHTSTLLNTSIQRVF